MSIDTLHRFTSVTSIIVEQSYRPLSPTSVTKKQDQVSLEARKKGHAFQIIQSCPRHLSYHPEKNQKYSD